MKIKGYKKCVCVCVFSNKKRKRKEKRVNEIVFNQLVLLLLC